MFDNAVLAMMIVLYVAYAYRMRTIPGKDGGQVCDVPFWCVETNDADAMMSLKTKLQTTVTSIRKEKTSGR